METDLQILQDSFDISSAGNSDDKEKSSKVSKTPQTMEAAKDKESFLSVFSGVENEQYSQQQKDFVSSNPVTKEIIEKEIALAIPDSFFGKGNLLLNGGEKLLSDHGAPGSEMSINLKEAELSSWDLFFFDGLSLEKSQEQSGEDGSNIGVNEALEKGGTSSKYLDPDIGLSLEKSQEQSGEKGQNTDINEALEKGGTSSKYLDLDMGLSLEKSQEQSGEKGSTSGITEVLEKGVTSSKYLDQDMGLSLEKSQDQSVKKGLKINDQSRKGNPQGLSESPEKETIMPADRYIKADRLSGSAGLDMQNENNLTVKDKTTDSRESNEKNPLPVSDLGHQKKESRIEQKENTTQLKSDQFPEKGDLHKRDALNHLKSNDPMQTTARTDSISAKDMITGGAEQVPESEHQKLKSVSSRIIINDNENTGNNVVKIKSDTGDNSLLSGNNQFRAGVSEANLQSKEVNQLQKPDQSGVMGQIVEKAALNIKNGQKEIRIDLKPEFLGRLQMNISTEKNQVIVRILTATPLVKEMLENNVNQLKADLVKNGLEIDELNISVAYDSDRHESGDAYNELRKSQGEFNDRADGGDIPDNSPEETIQRIEERGKETLIDFFA